MTTIRTLIRVSPDHAISGVAPAAVPAGEHEAVIAIPSRPRLRIADLPVHPSGWNDAMSLRRADLYDDDGR